MATADSEAAAGAGPTALAGLAKGRGYIWPSPVGTSHIIYSSWDGVLYVLLELGKQHGVEGRARSVVAVNLLVAADKAMVSAATAASAGPRSAANSAAATATGPKYNGWILRGQTPPDCTNS